MRKNQERLQDVFPLEYGRSLRRTREQLLSLALVLKIFFLFFALLLPNKFSLATSFGPVPLVGQVQYAPYVVHGQIRSSKRVEIERTSGRPHSYWELEVIAQKKGAPLGSRLLVRQPGGEVGEMGYRVASSAEFRAGEEVYLMLRDTNENGVKELMGLANGKYTVEGKGSKASLQNGLGFTLLDAKGARITPESFDALIERVKNNSVTEADRSIILNRPQDLSESSHNHGAEVKDSHTEARKDSSKQPGGSHDHPQQVQKAQEESKNAQENSTPTDTPVSGVFSWGWLLAAVALAILVWVFWKKA